MYKILHCLIAYFIYKSSTLDQHFLDCALVRGSLALLLLQSFFFSFNCLPYACPDVVIELALRVFGTLEGLVASIGFLGAGGGVGALIFIFFCKCRCCGRSFGSLNGSGTPDGLCAPGGSDVPNFSLLVVFLLLMWW